MSDAFEYGPAGLAVIALTGADRGRCLRANRALAQLLGRPASELAHASLPHLLTADPAAPGPAALLDHLGAGRPAAWETGLIRPDGTEVWVAVTGTPMPAAGGGADHGVIQVLDISERRRFEGQLRYLADHDSLTGLFNRHRFEEELGRVLAESRRYARRAALLMVDLDGFKAINDRFGHPVGDELITRIGQLLAATVRSTDVVARLGGDEFAIILLEAGAEDAMTAAENLLTAVRRDGRVVAALGDERVTASIGIATVEPGQAVSEETLIAEADAAMYGAKADGGDRYRVHGLAPRRADPRPGGSSWPVRLREALDEDRFVLEAQPITRFADGTGAHFELLLRMRGTAGELIAPAVFLTHAERLELMGEIDRWVLLRAVRLLHAHHRAGNDISVAVNVSGKTMNDRGLAADLAAMLAAHPFPAGRLVIEVTETAAIDDIEGADRLARELRGLGCRFALDDFGSGFASFYYLKHLEFDYLKIDGEFIAELTRSETDQLVVRSVVEVARGLGTATVAEFVSDDATVEMLRGLGVDFGQGFHLGRPGSLERTLPPLDLTLAAA